MKTKIIANTLLILFMTFSVKCIGNPPEYITSNINSFCINRNSKTRNYKDTYRIDERPSLKTQWIFKEKIGKGAFGEIHLASFRGEDVAVKVMDITNLNIEEINFLINHNKTAGVPKIYGCEIGTLNLYMVIELLYKDLGSEQGRALLHQRNFQERIDIYAGFFGTLQTLHKENLLHRDIKPANMMVKNDKTSPVFMIDFGMIGPDWLTIVAGSPLYASPKLASKSTKSSKPDDIWASWISIAEIELENNVLDLEYRNGVQKGLKTSCYEHLMKMIDDKFNLKLIGYRNECGKNVSDKFLLLFKGGLTFDELKRSKAEDIRQSLTDLSIECSEYKKTDNYLKFLNDDYKTSRISIAQDLIVPEVITQKELAVETTDHLKIETKAVEEKGQLLLEEIKRIPTLNKNMAEVDRKILKNDNVLDEKAKPVQRNHVVFTYGVTPKNENLSMMAKEVAKSVNMGHLNLVKNKDEGLNSPPEVKVQEKINASRKELQTKEQINPVSKPENNNMKDNLHSGQMKQSIDKIIVQEQKEPIKKTPHEERNLKISKANKVDIIQQSSPIRRMPEEINKENRFGIPNDINKPIFNVVFDSGKSYKYNQSTNVVTYRPVVNQPHQNINDLKMGHQQNISRHVPQKMEEKPLAMLNNKEPESMKNDKDLNKTLEELNQKALKLKELTGLPPKPKQILSSKHSYVERKAPEPEGTNASKDYKRESLPEKTNEAGLNIPEPRIGYLPTSNRNNVDRVIGQASVVKAKDLNADFPPMPITTFKIDEQKKEVNAQECEIAIENRNRFVNQVLMGNNLQRVRVDIPRSKSLSMAKGVHDNNRHRNQGVEVVSRPRIFEKIGPTKDAKGQQYDENVKARIPIKEKMVNSAIKAYQVPNEQAQPTKIPIAKGNDQVLERPLVPLPPRPQNKRKMMVLTKDLKEIRKAAGIYNQLI
jgi:serine/threonine protein kinase